MGGGTGGTVTIFDTAGRQEIDEDLIKELQGLVKFLEPKEVLLVADAATGQQAVSVAKHFDEAVGITGLVADQARWRCPWRRCPVDAIGHAQADQIHR